MELLAASIEVVEKPFQWGPYILVALGLIAAVGGYFIKRLITALDAATTSLNTVQLEVAVVKSVITSSIEYRLKALEQQTIKENEK